MEEQSTQEDRVQITTGAGNYWYHVAEDRARSEFDRALTSRRLQYLTGDLETRFPLTEGAEGIDGPSTLSVPDPITVTAPDTTITTSGGLLAQTESTEAYTYNTLTRENLERSINDMFHSTRRTRWVDDSFHYYSTSTGTYFTQRTHVPGPGASQHKPAFNPLKTLKLV
jgi:hypothetical protein